MLSFTYVTSMDLETPLKDKAGVTVEEDGFLGFLIKCGALDLQASGFHHRLDNTRFGSMSLQWNQYICKVWGMQYNTTWL